MVDQAMFYRYVREVFARLDDRPYLARHPLASLLAESEKAVSAEALRRVLIDAIEQLRPPAGTPRDSVSWRRWRCLSLRYTQGVSTKRIAQDLLVSDRQARRDHLMGLDALAEVLWATYCESTVAAKRQASASDVVGKASYSEDARSRSLDDLETEVTSVLSLAPEGPTSLVDQLESALTTVRSLAEAHQTRFEISFPENLCPVAVNQAVLRQILLLLLTGTLQSRVSRNVLLSIESLTEFVQLHIRTTTRQGSLLPLESVRDAVDELTDAARRLAEAQGVALRVEIDAEGTRVTTLRIPFVQLATVLIVDDNPDVAQLFRRYLAGADYRLVQARTPPTALKLARELHPDVIILDVMMPSQDGWQILQQLRDDQSLSSIPVIVCSILPERSLALSLGVADFLAKPVTRRDLIAALERCLGERGPAVHPGSHVSIASPRPPSVRLLG